MRPRIQRMPGVGTVVDIGVDLGATPHNEAAQRPVTAAHRETPGTGIIELVQRTDYARKVDLGLSHGCVPARFRNVNILNTARTA